MDALDEYLRRTSKSHISVRLTSNVLLAVIFLATVGFEYLVWIAAWMVVVGLAEWHFSRNVQKYFRDGADISEEGLQERYGRVSSPGRVKFYIYMMVLIPTLVLTTLYTIPSLALMFFPGAGPAVGLILTTIVLLNVAGQHIYKVSMPFITIGTPAIALFGNILALTGHDNMILACTISSIFLVQTLSIATAGARSYGSLIDTRRSAEEESVARQSADEANLAKSQFLANMSHELRTPLNAIIGYSEMMQEDAVDDGRSHDVEDHKRIISAGKRLLVNINEILDFSKIEAGRMDTEMGEFDLTDMVDGTVDTIRPLLANKDVTVTVSMPDTLPLAWSDQHKLEQCLLNLLSNAAKFTRQGHIDIVGSITKTDDKLGFVIDVRDTGIGLNDEQMSRLFTPFTQADESFTREYGGTGLGLVITKRLIELLGGSISVVSQHGEGSVFSLHFPIANIADTLVFEHNRMIRNGQPAILIVDDDMDVHELLSRDLKSIGFDVLHAASAEQARAELKRIKPALVILDLNLPGESGLQLLTSMRTESATEALPVLIYSVDSERQKTMDAGATFQLTKPAKREELIATVVRFAVGQQTETINAENGGLTLPDGDKTRISATG